MKTWVRKTLSVGVLAAGALLFAPGAAHADNGGIRQTTGVNNGILNGTQIAVPVRVPVNVVGNSLGILGIASAQGVGVNQLESAQTTEGHRRGPRAVQATGVNNGILNGSQVYLPINVPVNVVGNSIAALGSASSTGVGVNRVRESGHTTEGGWGGWGGASQVTGANNGILNGTQIYAPIDVPINVCGNSIALLGGAYSQALCANSTGGGFGHSGGHWKKESGQVAGGARQITGANNGIANGTQLLAPISLPVNLSGNAVAVAGIANSRAVSKNESGHGDDFVQATGVNNGILNGTQVAIPINVPINVCGNSLGILGAASSTAGCVNDLGGIDDDWGWDGDHHGHKGHGHGHGGQNAGDNGNDDGDYLGDNGADDNGYGGTKPASNGYGDTKPASNGYGDVADDQADDSYGDVQDDAAGSGSDSNGGREAAKGSPVADLTEAVGSVSDTPGLGQLGLLNTLR
ncbi:chaplin family protein [Actinoplanes sp. CA-142083]|uniref:chaplin family protein n=1 Tax=Actinoplanes sp. CA-142083 TaxID=3239903 RepID=UPI003D8A0055